MVWINGFGAVCVGLIPLHELSNITTYSSGLISPSKYINSINSSNVYILLDLGRKALLYFRISSVLVGISPLNSYASFNFNPNFNLVSFFRIDEILLSNLIKSDALSSFNSKIPISPSRGTAVSK